MAYSLIVKGRAVQSEGKSETVLSEVSSDQKTQILDPDFPKWTIDKAIKTFFELNRDNGEIRDLRDNYNSCMSESGWEMSLTLTSAKGQPTLNTNSELKTLKLEKYINEKSIFSVTLGMTYRTGGIEDRI